MFKRFILSILLLITLWWVQGCTDPKVEVPILIKKLHSSSTSEQSQAALRLGRIGSPHANMAVKELISLLNSKNIGVQSAASYALREIGTDQALKAVEQAKKRR